MERICNGAFHSIGLNMMFHVAGKMMHRMLEVRSAHHMSLLLNRTHISHKQVYFHNPFIFI